jgi:hypothetical protein
VVSLKIRETIYVRKSFADIRRFLECPPVKWQPRFPGCGLNEAALSDNENDGQQELERSLMLNQIARIVADAKGRNKPISTAQHAPHLFANFPHANMPIAKIVEENTACRSRSWRAA